MRQHRSAQVTTIGTEQAAAQRQACPNEAPSGNAASGGRPAIAGLVCRQRGDRRKQIQADGQAAVLKVEDSGATS